MRHADGGRLREPRRVIAPVVVTPGRMVDHITKSFFFFFFAAERASTTLPIATYTGLLGVWACACGRLFLFFLISL